MIEEHENQETSLQDLIDVVERDDLPTNDFTIQDKDPMVILGKLNEVIAYLQTLQATINSSDSKANEALQKAIQAVADATQALSVANGIDAKATQALANAIEAVGTANTALSASNTALSTANTAISTANTALSSANDAEETAENALYTAESAETKADTAITTANGAKTTAEGIDAKATTALYTAESAETKADTAITTANGAKTTAEGIDAKATTALSNSQTAVSTANTAETKAQEALDQVVAGIGTKIYRGSQLLNSLDIKPIEDDIADNTTAITALQNGKVDKVTGKQLSTEDFTTAEKNKLAGLNNYDDTQVQTDITALQNGKQPVGDYITQGGTLTAPLKVTGGDSATAGKIILDTNGQITNESTGILLGRSGTNLLVGHSSHTLRLRGSATRPTYNNTNMALATDLSGKADINNTNQAITANSVTATTGNFDNINTSFSNFNTLLGQKLQVITNGTNWLKLSNNLIIVWGTTTPNGATHVDLPVSFQTTSYAVIGIAVSSATNKTLTLNVHSKNDNYFVCHGEWQTGNGQGATTGDITFNYLVVGY